MVKKGRDLSLYSATDLINHLACHHLTFLNFKKTSHEKTEKKTSTINALLQEKGQTHELNYLKMLESEGKRIISIPKETTFQEKVKLTHEALYAGPDIIYQGMLYNHPWKGISDFLIKTDLPSKLGDFSYEVVDAKLARNPEPKHIIQLCFYNDLLENAQGLKPNKMHLILGNNEQHSYRVEDFIYYYLYAKKRFKIFIDNMPNTSYPEPCAYCKFCDWFEHCSQQWQEDGHLSLVANIQRSQIDKLLKANINTIEELALLPENTKIMDLERGSFKRLRAQASLQVSKSKTGVDINEVIDPQPGKGFSRMPMPDSGDLFFDMEGDPLYPNGLEYLFGVYYIKDDQFTFLPFWAHDHVQECEAFKSFMKFLGDHIAKYPNAHIYHYNHYETTALKRLACRYGMAEEQLDNLLRSKQFVDLYKVVRESIRTSEPGYSIKNLEKFYMKKREGSVVTATESIVFYDQWRKTQDDELLNQIVHYNEVDCISTYQLREWLLTLRPENTIWFKYLPENDEQPTIKERKDWEIEYEQYQKALLESPLDINLSLKQLMADLLEYHNRELKPQWWAMFDRQDKFEDELIDDAECIGGLTLVEDPVPEKKSLIYTYKFPPQEYKLRKGDLIIDVATTSSAGSIFELDETSCLIKIKKGIKESLPQSLSIGPSKPIEQKTMRKAIYKVADSILRKGNQFQAILDILNNRTPRIKGKTDNEPIISSDSLLMDSIKAILNLDSSYLFIQGPPGAGKTYTSAHIAVELMRQGKKIGIAANSHKAIHNLLERIEMVALEKDFNFVGIKKSSGDDSIYDGRFIRSENKNEKIPMDALLLAGTSWLFSDERFEQHLDYLFIEEAGQVSLANVVAMGTSAKNIILVGDQMQLSQPKQGVHPGDAGKSILEYLLGEHATIPPDRGIFLNKTWRLNSRICKFISQAFYDGRLEADSSNDKRLLVFHNPISGITAEGIHIIPATHANCSQKSEEEGIIIKKYYQDLIRQKFKDKNDNERDLTQEDILVVSPYNVQVNHLKSILPSDARVGTVDKFQGQEAPIVLISMVTSSAEDLPRNIEFLYSKNRLNVALSRAQCLALVVISPKLFEIPSKTIQQMKLINIFCWLDEYVMRKFV